MIKGYVVTYRFKTEEEYEFYQSNEPEDFAPFKWLNDTNTPVVDVEEGEDDSREYNTECIDFSFRLKKDATKFAKQFKLEVSGPYNVQPFNPWLPEGCDNYEDVVDIYGAFPGDR